MYLEELFVNQRKTQQTQKEHDAKLHKQKALPKVSVGDALRDRFWSLKIICNKLPIIPSASIIQNNTREPIRGVMIMGNKQIKMVGPLKKEGSLLTAKQKKPMIITSGVTIKVYESVKLRAL